MWLVASSVMTELPRAHVRDLRRFNPPIQLAVAAAHEVVAHATAPAEAAIISLAPCQSGSPELHRWVREIEAGDEVKVNPTHTLHAVDNLALSVLTMMLKNHAWGMSLGGAAGMMWSALELVLERDEREVIVLAGDQTSGFEASPAVGVAVLFARVPAGKSPKLAGVERTNRRSTTPPIAHTAAGAIAMLADMRGEYRVPSEHGDCFDDIVVRWEIA